MPTALYMTVSLPTLSRERTADFSAELSNWLINAFNGEWLKIANAKPKPANKLKEKRGVEELKEGVAMMKKRWGVSTEGSRVLPSLIDT